MNIDALIETSQTSSTFDVTQWRDGGLTETTDQLAEEVPIALVYNGVSHAVMLATPQDLEDFALGFSLTEGILQNKSELYDITVQHQSNGIELQLDVSAEKFSYLKARRRNMAGRTGCGLCGAESLGEVFRLPDANNEQVSSQKINGQSILKALQEIKAFQTLQLETGATHACAWADDAGQISLVREDVGRHNALDKLIGALAKQEKKGGFIITTSRASYEMVQKVVMAGFNVLAAISAPTALAVRIANATNVSLLGFVRDKQYVVYSHGASIQHQVK